MSSKSSKGAATFFLIWIPVAVVVLIALSGCQTQPQKPCGTLSCLMKAKQTEYRTECIKGFQDAARKRPFKTIWPYDDPTWQHNYCRAKARRMVK